MTVLDKVLPVLMNRFADTVIDYVPSAFSLTFLTIER